MSKSTGKKVVIDDKQAWDTNKKRVVDTCGCRAPKNSGFSQMKFLRRIGTKVSKALRSMSGGSRNSRKVSSATLARSHSYAESSCLDSQRAEAIEDCIEFLNSSSSLQRSNSVKSSCYSNNRRSI